MRLLHSDEISDFVFFAKVTGMFKRHVDIDHPKSSSPRDGSEEQYDFRLVAHSQDDLACRLSSFQFLLRFRCFGEWKFFMDVEF